MPSSKIDLTGRGDYLTEGEILLVARRRRGLSQVEMARAKNLTRHAYVKRENSPKIGSSRRLAEHGLLPGEKALLHRRRAGRTQSSIGAELGISRVWINRMERGLEDSTELLLHWENQR